MYNGQCYTSFPTPPKGLPALESPKKKKMSPDEVDKFLQRLSHRKERQIMLEPLTPRKVLKKEVIQSSTDRLYSQELSKRKRKEEQKVAAFTSREGIRYIDTHQLTESVDRLFKQGLNKQKDLSKKLHEKYNAKPEKKLVNAEGVKELNERFYSSRKVCISERPRVIRI